MNITKMFDNTDFLEDHPSGDNIVKKGYIASYLYNIELKLQKLFPNMKFRDYTAINNRHFSQNNLVGLGNNLVEKMFWITDTIVKQQEEINNLKKEISILKGNVDDGK